MQTQRINISLPYDIIKHLNQAVSKGKRSRFIASAVSEKLAKKRDVQKELTKSLRANRKLDEIVMKEWSVTEVEGWPE
jgi:metal-responsive CopG/Arc/MetJ family transcriptional regulator